jgi:hypothetical protein
MPDAPMLDPDGPHSPANTAAVGDLLDQCSRLIVYAAMPRRGGLMFPADAYALIADLYSATSRIGEVCGHLASFIDGQATREGVYEARGRDVAGQADAHRGHMGEAAKAAAALTKALQAAQADIAGLGVTEAGGG